jgi:hypothetical protein
MKRGEVYPSILVILVLAILVAQSLVAGSPSLPDERSLSGCGVARGFAAGAMLGAGIATLVPGGQTAAIILGVSALTLRVGMSLLC